MGTALTAALAEMHEAKAGRDRINADLDVLKEQYASLGQQASAAGPVVEKTALLAEQHKVAIAQSPLQRSLEKNGARIEAAKAAVAKAAEQEA